MLSRLDPVITAGAIAFVAATLLLVVVPRRRAGRGAVLDQLRHLDPHRRVEAIDRIEADGVVAHADALTALLAMERDPAVLARVQRLVDHTQWEPTDSSFAVAALRAWAANVRHDAGPASAVPAWGRNLGRLSAALGEPVQRLVIHDRDVTMLVASTRYAEPGASR